MSSLRVPIFLYYKRSKRILTNYRKTSYVQALSIHKCKKTFFNLKDHVKCKILFLTHFIQCKENWSINQNPICIHKRILIVSVFFLPSLFPEWLKQEAQDRRLISTFVADWAARSSISGFQLRTFEPGKVKSKQLKFLANLALNNTLIFQQTEHTWQRNSYKFIINVTLTFSISLFSICMYCSSPAT